MSTAKLALLTAAIAGSAFSLGRTTSAEPATFGDLGFIAAPAEPAGAQESILLPDGTFNYSPTAPSETLTVKWLLFTLTAPIAPPLFLDIDAGTTSLTGASGTLTLALYGPTGNLLVTDTGVESSPLGTSPALSFGSLVSRGPGLNGQDGDLGTGDYWIALAAGSPPAVSTGATNWDVTTSSSILLGLFAPGTSIVTLSVNTGNTRPVTPPANDTCAGALAIGESNGDTPAWVGSNALATNDAFFPCNQLNVPSLLPKDVWFRYTPSATGTVQITARNAPSSFAAPVLASFANDCASSALQCVGGAPENFGEPVSLTLPVVQGEPVLLALGAFGGSETGLQLDIRLLTPDCPADVGGPGQSTELDGALTADDIIVFLNRFFASDARADIAGPGQSTTPDTQFTADDIIVYLNRFFAGC